MVTTKEAKKYLNQAYEARNTAVVLSYELAEIKKTSKKLIANYELAFGSAGCKYDISAEIAKIEEKAEEVKKEWDAWLEKANEIKAFIGELDTDEQIKKVLMFRYINFQKWAVIAAELKYSERHVMRLHYLGLKTASEKLKNVSKCQ